MQLDASVRNYQAELGAMPAQSNAKLALFGPHAQLRAEVDRSR